MPGGKCHGCGKMTNSATSDWWTHKYPKDYWKQIYPVVQGYAEKCFLAWDEDGKPVRGCAYDKCDPWTKKYVDDYIQRKGMAVTPASEEDYEEGD